VSFGFLKKLQKNITKYKKSAKLAADTLYFFMQKDIMKSISYFNIKLLCAAFILSASLTHTTEIPTTPPATVAAKFSAENEHMFHTIYLNKQLVNDLRQQVRRSRRTNLLLTTGLAAYITYTNGSNIVSSIEEKWTTLKDQYTAWYNSVTKQKKEEVSNPENKQ